MEKKIIQRLSYKERQYIEYALAKNDTMSTIARYLRRSVSTISYEIKKNRCNKKYYYAEIAQDKSERCKHKSRIRPKTENPHIIKKIDAYLKCNFAPHVMVGRAQLEKCPLGISHESIYKIIENDAKKGGEMYLLLPYRRKKRKSRKNTRSLKTFERGKTRIDHRPAEIDAKNVCGHWETDSIMGKENKSACHTMIERFSCFSYTKRMEYHTSADTHSTLSALVESYPDKVLSFTTDNGSEFSYYFVKGKDHSIPMYFTYPASPHQKGLIEHYNKLFRRFFPKGTDFRKVSQEQINRVVDIINHTPRKILGFRTPYEVFFNTFVRLVI